MGWRDLLFKPDVSEAATAETPETPIAARLRLVQSGQIGTTALPTVAGPAAPDPEFTAELQDALKRTTLPGFKEFTAQLDLLSAAIPDESVRFHAALASTAAFLKLTPDQIVQAVQEQLDLLDRSKELFQATLRTEAEQRTATYTKHLTDVETRLAANRAEYDRLTTDKNDTQRQLTDVQTETTLVQDRFQGAYQPIYDRIHSMMARLLRARA